MAGVPAELTNGPFTLAEAAAAGVTPSALRSRPWRRLGKAIYCWEFARDDPWQLLAAWRRALGADVAFGGYTAAWMHGLDCEPPRVVDVVVPTASAARSCSGLRVRHCDLRSGERVTLRGLRLTSTLRTVRDICLGHLEVDALIVLDSALRRSVVDRVALSRYSREVAGLPGSARMRKLAQIAEPAESPMETRLRWMLLAADLPRPEVQSELRDADGRFIGRADLYFPAARLVVEFDGGNHRERLISDDRRQNLLISAGFTVLRFTSADLFGKPEIVVGQVRAALDSGSHSARNIQIARKPAA